MKNKNLLYNKLICNISRSIYRSINENYFKISNIQKRNSIIDNSNEIENAKKDEICDRLLNGEEVLLEEIKYAYNHYNVKNSNELKALILQQIEYYGDKCDLNWINTSRITDMNCMFFNLSFNGDISQWNVSKVEDMSHMFQGSKFNQDISKWNVKNVRFFSDIYHDSNLIEKYKPKLVNRRRL